MRARHGRCGVTGFAAPRRHGPQGRKTASHSQTSIDYYRGGDFRKAVAARLVRGGRTVAAVAERYWAVAGRAVAPDWSTIFGHR